jgi:hypothetical protein
MKLYTSYFAQLRKFPPNLIGLSTAAWNPKWRPMGKDKRGVICVDCPPFKPGRECEGLCQGKCDPKHPADCQFLTVYTQQLDRIPLVTIQDNLGRLAAQIGQDEGFTDVDFAFLVYETPTNPCSERRAIQNYFKKRGIEVEEWQPKGE